MDGNKKLQIKDIIPYIQTILLAILIVQVSIILYYTYNLNMIRQPLINSKNNLPQKVHIDLKKFSADSKSIGPEDAKITIIKFNSFSCKYCAMDHVEIKKILAKYPNDVRIIYKHYNRGETDSKSAQAVECSGEQDKFWNYYNRQLEKQNDDPVKVAKDIGLNLNRFNSCIASKKYMKKASNDTKEARDIGVTGTPAFIMNDELVIGYRTFDVLDKMIQNNLKK